MAATNTRASSGSKPNSPVFLRDNPKQILFALKLSTSIALKASQRLQTAIKRLTLGSGSGRATYDALRSTAGSPGGDSRSGAGRVPATGDGSEENGGVDQDDGLGADSSQLAAAFFRDF